MRVTVVTTWFPTDVDPSSGTFVAKDARAVADRHEVRVVHLVPPHQDDGSRSTRYLDLPVVRIPMATTRPDHIAQAGRALPRLLAGADIVHTMAISSLLPLAWWRPDAPWVHTEHWSGLTTPETLPATWRAALPLVRRLHRRPDVTTAVCDFLARAVRSNRTGPTTVVPCIVPPLSSVPPRPERTPKLRLVAVGGLVDRKDPIVAVRTLASLRAHGVAAELRWVGEGPLRQTVRDEAGRLGLADDVHLLGHRDTAGVSAALADSDMFFLPTRAENFCVSAAEALVHGRPVVVGATGGQGEYISRAVGRLVAKQDPEAYAAAILDLDAVTRDLPATDIADTIGDRFSPRTVADGYDAAYALAAGARKTRRG